MKLAFAFLTAVFAMNAHAAPPERFVCGAMGNQNSISLQVGGARYGDRIFLELNEKETEQMMLRRDQGKGIGYTDLHGFLIHGACKVGIDPVLVTCAVAKDDYGFLDWKFQYHESLAKDLQQLVTVSRRTEVKELDLVVTRVGRKAHLKLKAVLNDGIEQNRVLTLDRPLATLDHDWYKCRFE